MITLLVIYYPSPHRVSAVFELCANSIRPAKTKDISHGY